VITHKDGCCLHIHLNCNVLSSLLIACRVHQRLPQFLWNLVAHACRFVAGPSVEVLVSGTILCVA
jgi:hypothetical protein